MNTPQDLEKIRQFLASQRSSGQLRGGDFYTGPRMTAATPEAEQAAYMPPRQPAPAYGGNTGLRTMEYMPSRQPAPMNMAYMPPRQPAPKNMAYMPSPQPAPLYRSPFQSAPAPMNAPAYGSPLQAAPAYGTSNASIYDGQPSYSLKQAGKYGADDARLRNTGGRFNDMNAFFGRPQT